MMTTLRFSAQVCRNASSADAYPWLPAEQVHDKVRQLRQ
jgi:hypothetical protein